MKRFLIILGILLAIVALLVVTVIILTPWMDRWGTTPDERTAGFPGDDLVKSPAHLTRSTRGYCKLEQTNPECTAIRGWKTWWDVKWRKMRLSDLSGRI
jgi:hypothetical protein